MSNRLEIIDLTPINEYDKFRKRRYNELRSMHNHDLRRKVIGTHFDKSDEDLRDRWMGAERKMPKSSFNKNTNVETVQNIVNIILKTEQCIDGVYRWAEDPGTEQGMVFFITFNLEKFVGHPIGDTVTKDGKYKKNLSDIEIVFKKEVRRDRPFRMCTYYPVENVSGQISILQGLQQLFGKIKLLLDDLIDYLSCFSQLLCGTQTYHPGGF